MSFLPLEQRWLEGEIKRLFAERLVTAYIFQNPSDGTEERNPKMSHAEILDSDDGQFYFVIKGMNGQVLATSETYKTKEGCHGGIAALYTIEGNVYGKHMTVDATESAPKKQAEPVPEKGTVQAATDPADEKAAKERAAEAEKDSKAHDREEKQREKNAERGTKKAAQKG